MEWRGKRIQNAGELTDAIAAIRTKEEAAEFLELYIASGVPRATARQNIGYLAAYNSREVAQRIWKLFDTSHPFFGTDWPTPERAFEMGQEWAKRG